VVSPTKVPKILTAAEEAAKTAAAAARKSAKSKRVGGNAIATLIHAILPLI